MQYEVLSQANSFLSLLPAIIILTLVIFTRRVFLSIGVGLISGAFILSNFSILGTLSYLLLAGKGLFFYENGDLNSWNLFIFGFLFCLSFLSYITAATGGLRSFSVWARSKIKDGRQSQLFTFFLGIVIFIDEYFNVLALGQVGKPLFDAHNVSRAKLAYIIDSTASPTCVISPISSWGAAIIGTIGALIANDALLGQENPASIFLKSIPFNFYAIFTLGFVFVTICLNIDFSAMRKSQEKLDNKSENIKPYVEIETKTTPHFSNLIIPLAVLLISIMIGIFIIGYNNSVKEGLETITFLNIIGNTDSPKALFFGGLISIISAILLTIPLKISAKNWMKLGKNAVTHMLPLTINGLVLVCLAWMLAGVSGNLETGKYILSIIKELQIPVNFIPLILFVTGVIASFSTGTSWGTFFLMLPIASQMSIGYGVELLTASFGAVLAGSVFGDHCSPISDTTILSSNSAGCNVIEHTFTQFPYAVSMAIVSLIGYISFGISGSWKISFFSALIAFTVITAALKKSYNNSAIVKKNKLA